MWKNLLLQIQKSRDERKSRIVYRCQTKEKNLTG